MRGPRDIKIQMTIKGKRIFNYRPLCVFAISLILGLIIAEASYGESIAIIITLCLAATLSVILLAVFKRTRKFLYIPLALLIGLVALTSSNAVYDKNLTASYSGEFYATVSSVIETDGETASFIVSDIKTPEKKVKYKCAITVKVDKIPDFNAGDRIKLVGRINGCKHEKFSTLYASGRADNQVLSAFCSEVEKISEAEPKPLLKLQMSIKRVLFENNDRYTASICQALILGDKTGMDGALYDNIKSSGLAHVLAVSGLHISTVAAAVYFILKKLKVKPKICFVIISLLTFFYSMICSFSASSLRAFIMCAVLFFANAFGFKKDSLSSLSLAAILILIFRPTAIMEVGFLLSFYAVLGLMLFSDAFKRVGMKAVNKISPKRHFGKTFVDIAAVSLSTNLLTIPIVAYFFGEVPILFLLANFIILPYMMVVYVILLICTLLSLITTFGGFVWIMKFLLIPFRFYVGVIGNLSFASVPMSASVALIVCYTILMLFLSGYVFLSKRKKAVGGLVGASLTIAICSLAALI